MDYPIYILCHFGLCFYCFERPEKDRLLSPANGLLFLNLLWLSMCFVPTFTLLLLPWELWAYTHTCTNTHSQAHTCTHLHTLTQMHTFMCTDSPVHTHTHTIHTLTEWFLTWSRWRKNSWQIDLNPARTIGRRRQKLCLALIMCQAKCLASC